MAKVILNEHSVAVQPWWEKSYSAAIGLGAGLAWWVLTGLLNRYVVEPLACRNLSTASACSDSLGVAGSIAAIIVAVLGAIVLVRALQPRPIIISAATALLLWDLGTLVSGLDWWLALLGALVVYGFSYALFALIAQLPRVILALFGALIVVVAIRLLISL